ncbi:MAG: PEGA domain-containing protein [Anaerolineae bacterium]|nr:PEGA domain-containing protein [Phycisphaerae bacterium]
MQERMANRLFPVIGLAVLLAMCAGGCGYSKAFTIRANPPDAQITVDGVPRGRGPITEQFTFDASRSSHRVTATRLGYTEFTKVITPESRKDVVFELKPLTRLVNFTVQPAPAIISIDGKPVAPGPVQNYSKTLEFTVDEKNYWTKYTVRAERPNFQPAEIVISWPDPGQNYVLNLEPMRKDLSITSNPPGASVSLDGEPLGTTPLIDKGREFPANLETNEFRTHKLTFTKAGFDPVESEISWDDAKSAYHIDLAAKAKVVRITTEPRDAQIEIDGKPVSRDASGVARMPLQFVPNEAGELKDYNVTVSKTSPDGEWEPVKFAIAWDNGKSDYSAKLKEILTQSVPLLTAVWEHDGAWSVTPRMIETFSTKEVGEGSNRSKPIQLSQLPKGTNIDTLTVSPDGLRVLFTVLMKDKDDFRSQMFLIRTDGDGGADLFSDGKSLDLTPAFTPGGESIVFSSNRSGKKMSIWEMAASGAPGITQRTSGESNDLWPVVDWDPRPRIYYQSMIDSRSEPRLFSSEIGNKLLKDLQTTGMQPRVSPKNDVVVFASINDKTGKRDLFKVGVNGGSAQNITGTPDVDEFDPVFNSQGTKIAFTSDAGQDADKRHNLDIWTLDLSKREGPQQITVNGSQDDCPAWDPAGNAIYFRSNRGGAWGIWKIPLK